MSSITSSVLILTKSQETGCARLARQQEDASHGNDVILLYIEMFLIM